MTSLGFKRRVLMGAHIYICHDRWRINGGLSRHAKMIRQGHTSPHCLMLVAETGIGYLGQIISANNYSIL